MDSRLYYFRSSNNHLLLCGATDENIISAVTLYCCVMNNTKIGIVRIARTSLTLFKIYMLYNGYENALSDNATDSLRFKSTKNNTMSCNLLIGGVIIR